MSYDIYLCGNCWGPIWFPFGDKMHLGTGWDCWHDEQSRTGPFAEIVEFWFDTHPDILAGLVSRAVEYFTAWDPLAANAKKSPLIPYLRKQLTAGRADVIHGFLKQLTREPRPKASAAVRELTRTAEWQRFVKRAEKRHHSKQKTAPRRAARRSRPVAQAARRGAKRQAHASASR